MADLLLRLRFRVGALPVLLSLDGIATGLYRVTLAVWDDKDQQSGTVAELKINVQP